MGRVKASQLPAATVAQTVYHGPYEGLGSRMAEFLEWIAAGTQAGPAISGSATWRAQSRTPTRPLGAPNSTGPS